MDTELAIPKNNHGVFALNIAFRLAKSYKKAPNIIAEEIPKLSLAECELVTSQTAGDLRKFIYKKRSPI